VRLLRARGFLLVLMLELVLELVVRWREGGRADVMTPLS